MTLVLPYQNMTEALHAPDPIQLGHAEVRTNDQVRIDDLERRVAELEQHIKSLTAMVSERLPHAGGR